MSMNSDRKTGGKALRSFRNSGLDIANPGWEPNSSTLKMAPGLMSPTQGKFNKKISTASMNASMDGDGSKNKYAGARTPNSFRAKDFNFGGVISPREERDTDNHPLRNKKRKGGKSSVTNIKDVMNIYADVK